MIDVGCGGAAARRPHTILRRVGAVLWRCVGGHRPRRGEPDVLLLFLARFAGGSWRRCGGAVQSRVASWGLRRGDGMGVCVGRAVVAGGVADGVSCWPHVECLSERVRHGVVQPLIGPDAPFPT
uniref:Uncharacterized protein n=1 Tax=Arundo donax TaxID=35708 RepID=A0A0A8ZNH0_ARUDO